MSTYLELVQELHTECNVGGTAPTSGNFASLTGTAAKLKEWVKQADIEIKAKWFNWKFLWNSGGSVSVVANTTDYAGATGLGVYDRTTFKIGTDKLRCIEYREWREVYMHADDLGGKPTVVCILPNNQLRFWPTPDASYTVTYDYYKSPTASTLSASTDESVIPAAYHRAIYYTAMMHYANWDNAPELKMQAQEGLYGRDGSKEEGWIHKLEAHQLPSANYAGAYMEHDYDIQVIAS